MYNVFPTAVLWWHDNNKEDLMRVEIEILRRIQVNNNNKAVVRGGSTIPTIC